MEDDTQPGNVDCSLEYATEEVWSEMKQMVKHPITRSKANSYMRKIYLISYDDSDDNAAASFEEKDDGEDGDDSENFRLAMELSLQSPSCQVVEKFSPAEAEPAPKRRSTDKSTSCEFCENLPAFPSQNKERLKFRLIRSQCNHFTAVSHCWPKDEEGHPKKKPQTYQYVKQLPDGTIIAQLHRPPDDVVDRAMEMARANGMRQLWIDSVCLPQDDSEEKQLAIQSMDLVYQRAYGSVGLLVSVFTDQNMIDALHTALRCKKYHLHALLGDRARTKQGLSDFFDMLEREPYFSRAWILQEGMAEPDKMMIVGKVAENVRLCFDRDLLPYHDIVPGSFSFPLSKIHGLASAAMYYLNRLLDEQSVWETQSLTDFDEIIAKLYRFDRLYPQPPHRKDHSLHNLDGSSRPGTLSKCNAALAVTYLRGRQTERPADRLAIMANICDYEVRLDTRAMARFPRLSIAYLALSLMNGDFSLLNQDFHGSQTIATDPSVPRSVDETLGLLPSLPEFLQKIRYTKRWPGSTPCMRKPHLYKISQNGLQCPARLWKVDRKVDMRALKERWLADWTRLWSYTKSVARFEGETDEEYMDRKEWVSQYVASGVSDDCAIDPVLGLNVVVLRHFKHDEANITTLHDIFLDVMRHLCDRGEESLAYSVWDSIRADYFDPQKQRRGEQIPDNLQDILANGRLLRYAHDMLHLDWNEIKDAGSFGQAWLIDRIMLHGFLWVGEAQKTTESLDNGEGPSTVPTRHEPVTRQDDAGYISDDLRGRTAVFDVDGPALIAIAADAALDRLPHPLEKATRVCWVVESARSANPKGKSPAFEDSLHTEPPREYKVVNKVKGMWPMANGPPRNRFHFT